MSCAELYQFTGTLSIDKPLQACGRGAHCYGRRSKWMALDLDVQPAQEVRRFRRHRVRKLVLNFTLYVAQRFLSLLALRVPTPGLGANCSTWGSARCSFHSQRRDSQGLPEIGSTGVRT